MRPVSAGLLDSGQLTGWGTDGVAVAAAIGGAGLVASLALERLARPGAAGLRRPAPALAIHAGLFLAAWSLLWLAGGRPGFAAGLTLALQTLLIAVSNAKYRALREPFVFSDFGLFSQAFRFPRLYLPFLGAARAAGVVVAAGAASVVGLALEPPWPGGRVLALGWLPWGPLLLVLGSRLAAAPRLEPLHDLSAVGLLPSLWLYWRAEVATRPSAPPQPWLERVRPEVGPELGPGPNPGPNPELGPHPGARPAGSCTCDPGPGGLPDLVMVQSESFFDVRRLYPGVRPQILEQFDRLRREALVHGLLEVPAWGANTMRTEFSVLTGIAPEVLGVHRFNPYRRFARGGVLALPHRLRDLGYETVCIHPYPMGFFGRDRIFAGLGFDRFIDIAAFQDAPRQGPYVADAAVTRKVAEVLGSAVRPAFIFVITMENHGPLHLERVGQDDRARLYLDPPPQGWDDLTVYLRHLANADRMFGDLAELLASRPRGGVLCLFGDHVPTMPKVYEDLGFADGRTDYLIWPSRSAPLGRIDRAAHALPLVLLDALALVGLPPGRAC